VTRRNSYQTRWDRLAARVGETDEMLNAVLAAVLYAYEQRYGCLGWVFDGQEWEDVYKDALKAHSASVAWSGFQWSDGVITMPTPGTATT
jgi:hypothetical protein